MKTAPPQESGFKDTEDIKKNVTAGMNSVPF
jgi:hypothetical protein